MVRLSRFAKLRDLWLDRTQVTDAGLDQLRHLKQLESVGLSGTRVTPTGIKDLRGNLPWIDVEY